MSSHICQVCQGMLQHHNNYQWYGTYDMIFQHQKSWEDLEKSKNSGCCICKAIFQRISSSDSLSTVANSNGSQPELGRGTADTDGTTPFLRAGLSLIKRKDSLEHKRRHDHEPERYYRLTFKVNGYRQVGSFILKPVPPDNVLPRDAPVSSNTGSAEVVELARQWLGECNEKHGSCTSIGLSDPKQHYPTRLVDLSTFDQGFVRVVMTRMRKPGLFDRQYWTSKVSSLRGAGGQWKIKGPYMTLSHRWGKVDPPIKLTYTTLEKFLWSGIPREELPKTFRHAMQFARQLGVNYMWIDSLCIVQKDKAAGKHEAKAMRLHQKDWKEESKYMDKVYGGSFLNISATAAEDCTTGLFYPRTEDRWWTGYVTVNRKGIPGSAMDEPHEELCQVRDQWFWDQSVGDTLLNRRAWVLQERLMAPRVLHFCKDQIAWECCEVTAAECVPEGVRNLHLAGTPLHRARMLKSLKPNIDGIRFYNDDADLGEDPKTGLRELKRWKSIVELYSKTELTNATDKLIALSGIAKQMHDWIGGDYLAGLWSKELAGQLLWYVEPQFAWANDSPVTMKSEGTFHYPGRRPRKQDGWRAPSWSWASVDVDNHVGIVYGTVTAGDREIKIEDYNVTPQEDSDEFGLLQSAWIKVTGMLREIDIISQNHGGSERYRWVPIKDREPAKDIYWNVYLDCPEDEFPKTRNRRQASCMFVGTDGDGYFCYLLLVPRAAESRDQYLRIGLVRIPSFDQSGKNALDSTEGIEKTITIF
ncbi:hypothetical protein DL770_008939 [Monosporascus sp. CRB-9-2]|nr:hypothetical protein DL770_008939 [Monosporascus sp. CRB-9-2]